MKNIFLTICIALGTISCGTTDSERESERINYYLPAGAKLIRVINSENRATKHTVLVEIEGKEYIWVFFMYGNASFGTLTSR